MASVQQTLSSMPASRLAKASASLAEAFGRTLLISTLHAGPRLDDASEATEQDLDALAAALPPERLARGVETRDAASPEPAMLAAIRQAEGAAPRLPAVLLPRSDAEAQTLLSEASAAGFEPGATPPRREIGLHGAVADTVRAEDRAVEIGARTTWNELSRVAGTHGEGVPAAALVGRFETPLRAAAAGLFGEATTSWFRGEAMTARLRLPPAAVGATDRAWLADADEASDLLASLCALYAPLYGETIGPVEAAMLHAAGLLPVSPRGRAIVRIVLSGPRPVRAVATRGADRAVRRRGGTLCARGGSPSEAQTLAVLAACGAARLDLPEAPAEPPPAAILHPRLRWVRGRTLRDVQCWYPRDLSRSVEQAHALLEDPARQAPSVEGSQAQLGSANAAGSHGQGTHGHDDGWEALRAALADALP